jgi:hypothetical protein
MFRRQCDNSPQGRQPAALRHRQRDNGFLCLFVDLFLNGDIPLGKLKLVQAWAEIHKEELMVMWDSKDFHKIKPLS